MKTGFLVCLVAVMASLAWAVDIGGNAGEDKPLKPGSFALQESIDRDIPESGEVSIGQAMANEVNRGAIIPSTTPDGAIRFVFDKPVNIFKITTPSFSKLYEVRINPTVKGTISWRGPTEMIFTPQKGQLRAGQWLEVSLVGKLPLASGGEAQLSIYKSWLVSAFGMGSKSSGYEVIPGKPRLVASLDSGSDCIGQGMLNLLYDQPVDPKSLASQLGSSIKAWQGDRTLAIELANPTSLSFDSEGVYDKSHIIRVSFKTLPAHGSQVQIAVPTLDENRKPVVQTLNKTINTRFFIESEFLDRAKDGAPADLRGTIYLKFSNRFDFGPLPGQLSINPQPLAMSIWRNEYDNSVQMNYRLAPGTTYTLALDRKFQDVLGNPLEQALNQRFRSRDLPPVLTAPLESLVLETGRNRLPLEVRNLASLNAHTWLVDDVVAFSGLLNQFSKLDDSATDGLRKGPDHKISLSGLNLNQVHRIDASLGGEPGLKLIEIEAPGLGTEARTSSTFTLLQTTDLGISSKISQDQAFVWVTSLASAKPLSGVLVRILNAESREICRGTTTKDGTVELTDFQLPETNDKDGPVLFITAELKNDRAVSRIRDASLSNAWQFSLPGRVPGTGILPAALFTERGVYRPGETVHIKAYLRPDRQFDGQELTLVVKDPQGQTVLEKQLEPDAFRGISQDLTIAEGAPVGEYQISLAVREWRTRASFRIEEYRVPTFQVEVKARDAKWVDGRTTTVDARAAYLQGALMGGSDISWRVYRQPADFSVATLPGYLFTGPRDPGLTGNFKMAQGVLNADSSAILSFSPESQDPAGPMRYIVQAAVTDVEQQTYANRVSRIVHPADLYVGALPPPRTIFQSGDKLSVPVVVVDTEGTIKADKLVEVWLDQIDYHSTTMMDEEGGSETYNRQVVNSRRLDDFKSKATPEPLNFTIDGTGAWELRLVVKDASGRSASTSLPLTISGEKPAAWPRFDLEKIDIVLDKAQYQVGEMAQLVVQTPFEDAEGLLTIEGEGVLDHVRFSLKKNTPAIKIQVKAAYAPNVFVSVVLIRGRTHDLSDAAGFETGAPAYRVGYARMNVDPAERRLAVSVKPAATVVRPGTTLDVKLKMTDNQGKPRAGSATVMVVDEAVLGLTAYKTPDPVALAYAIRLMGVRNATNLMDLPHSRRNRLEALFPGGDSDESQALSDQDQTRKLFKSTAYWNPSLPLAADGSASFSFAMPDNLSTYRIMVVAVDDQGRMGSGAASVMSNLPLMVQPVMPRFVYPGDQLTIQARVFNTTDKSGPVQLGGDFGGFKPSARPATTLTVGAKSDGLAAWTGSVEASAGQKLSVSFNAQLGKDKDALKTDIPVLSAGNRQTWVSSQALTGTGDLDLELPVKRLAGSGAYEVVLSTSALSELKDAVTYLMQYPNGCIEQTTSTAYPLVVLKDLLPAIGVEVNMADLKAFSEAGVKRILSFQTSSGGLAYWPGSNEPHAFATSFGLTCLLEAKKRGYEVPDTALTGMADFLEATLKKGAITESIPHGAIADGDTRALFVMTLGRLGRPQNSYIQELWRNKDKLTPFGLSFLAVAIRESKGDQALLEPVLEAVRVAAKINSDEAWYELERKGGYSMDSPLRTHASALLAYSLAGGKAAMSQQLLKGLLSRKQGGLWGNTQENVFGIMAIYQLVGGGAATGGAAGKSTVADDKLPRISINGVEWKASAMEQPSQGMFRIKFNDASLGKADRIRVHVDTKGLRMFATIRASADLPLDSGFRAARNNGFALKRSYETVDGKILDPGRIPLGTVVKVRLQLQASAAKNYVAVDDKLPAGFEVMNMNLATTDQAAMGTLSDQALKTLPAINYQEIRDHRVAFYVDDLPAGAWEFEYLAKASTAGTFLAPAGLAEAMYEPEFNGSSKVETVTIR